MKVEKYYRVIWEENHTDLLHILAKVNSFQMGESFVGETVKGDLLFLCGEEEHYEVTKEKFEGGW
jgi:hypothetical protein